MQRLIQLYERGLSFSKIAKDIGVTRNAAIGKVHRMKLQPREIAAITRSPALYTEPKPKQRRSRMRIVVVNDLSEPEPEPDPGVDYRCTILGLTDTTCRFPLWAFDELPFVSEKLYCGAPGAELSAGRPYCKKHTQLCMHARQ